MGDDRPFECTEPGCSMRFTNDDHLTVHKSKHAMSLAFASCGTRPSSILNYVADQTPTPTKFLRNCEEMGLFHELTKNPFDDAFKKATEAYAEGKSLDLHEQRSPFPGPHTEDEDENGRELHSNTLHTPNPTLSQGLLSYGGIGRSSHNFMDRSDYNPLLATQAPIGSAPAIVNATSKQSATGRVSSTPPKTLRQRSASARSPLSRPKAASTTLLSTTRARCLSGGGAKRRLIERRTATTEERVITDGEYDLAAGGDGFQADGLCGVGCYGDAEDSVAVGDVYQMGGGEMRGGVGGGASGERGEQFYVQSQQQTCVVGGSKPMLLQIVIVAPSPEVFAPLRHSVPPSAATPIYVTVPSSAVSLASTRSGRTASVPLGARTRAIAPSASKGVGAVAETKTTQRFGITSATRERLKAAIEQNAQQNALHNNMRVMSQAVDLVTTNGAHLLPHNDLLSTNGQQDATDVFCMAARSSLLRTALFAVSRGGVGGGCREGLGSGGGWEGQGVKLQVADTSTPMQQKPAAEAAANPSDAAEHAIRRQKYLKRNREAAARSRQRRQAWLAELEVKTQHFQAHNDRLRAERRELRVEARRLRSVLAAHSDCPVSLLRREQLGLNTDAHFAMQSDLVTSSGCTAVLVPHSFPTTVTLLPSTNHDLGGARTDFNDIVAMATLSTLANNNGQLAVRVQHGMAEVTGFESVESPR